MKTAPEKWKKSQIKIVKIKVNELWLNKLLK